MRKWEGKKNYMHLKIYSILSALLCLITDQLFVRADETGQNSLWPGRTKCKSVNWPPDLRVIRPHFTLPEVVTCHVHFDPLTNSTLHNVHVRSKTDTVVGTLSLSFSLSLCDVKRVRTYQSVIVSLFRPKTCSSFSGLGLRSRLTSLWHRVCRSRFICFKRAW